MNNYTVYEIYDLTNAPTITKRKIAHGGDLHEVAREVCGKSLYLSAPSIENGRAIIRIYGTNTAAYVIAPQGLREQEAQKRENERNAHRLCEAIRKFAESPAALDNLEGYLSYHFGAWFDKWASYPRGLVGEFERFAAMYDEDGKR